MRLSPIAMPLLALLATAANAAEPASLDFLAGDWILLDPAGKQVGSSHIEVELPNGVIHERRTDADGELPVWFVNSEAKGGWVQLFPGPSGSLREFLPKSAAGTWPLLLGSDVTLKDGRQARFRLTLEHASDDRSHRLLEMSVDDGRTWSKLFDYQYVRAKRP